MAKSRICSVDGCGKPLFARGWCSMHYTRWRENGDHLYGANKPSVCSVDGCYRAIVSKTMCDMHYRRELKHNDVNYTKSSNALQKIEKFVQFALSSTVDECFIWPSETGTPKFGVYIGRKMIIACRYICMRTHGAPPTPKHETAHSCGKGHLGCVNPRHLRWATASENQMDRIIHGTDVRGEKHPKVLLTEAEVRAIRQIIESGGLSDRDIGKLYSVSKECIAGIRTKRNWKWLA